MIQYLLVAYPRVRDVFANGTMTAETNKTFRVRRGAVTVDLGSPSDYTPSKQTVTVSGTTEDAPCIVTFLPK
jgi:hypothetical protein